MDVKPIQLIGKRAELLPMETSHIDALFEAGAASEIWRFLPDVMTTREHMIELVREAVAARERGAEIPFVIRDLESDRIVGSTRLLSISAPNRSIEIGWTWMNPAVWRTRINTECKYLLLRHCFEELSVVRVQLRTDARNMRSQRAIERLGAVKEGILRSSWILPDGYIRDSVFYSILPAEWPAVKARLEEALIASGGLPA